MDSLLPTVKIRFDDDRYELLDLTVNPIFYTRPRWLAPWPGREFYVWLELVVGHNSIEPLPLPSVILSFSDAFGSDSLDSLPLSDHIDPATDPINREIYSHFWTPQERDDLLRSGFGPLSWRAASPDSPHHERFRGRLHDYWKEAFFDTQHCKGAFAFWRYDYSDQGLYERLNYPCTFDAVRTDVEHHTNISVYPRLFSFEDGLATCDASTRLDHFESISFWYRYPYRTAAVAYAHDQHRDRFAFFHRVTTECQVRAALNVNSFPRLPFRFRIADSKPGFTTSPRFPSDPPPWVLDDDGCLPMYPLMPTSPETPPSPQLQLDHRITATIEDHRFESAITLRTLFAGLVASLFLTLSTEGLIDPKLNTLGFRGPMFFLLIVSGYYLHWLFSTERQR